MDQITLHNRIDRVLAGEPENTNCDTVSGLVSTNNDARRYLFAIAPQAWLVWLYENGFFDVLKQGAQDTTKYSYQIPELNYLARMSEEAPADVARVILNTPISQTTFNPEVIDRFLWICAKLPADELKQVVPKIQQEQWVPLMGALNRWGFEYKQMFETLAAANDSESTVTLASAILSINEGGEQRTSEYGTDNPFYFNDLHNSEVFERLADVGEEKVEDALALTTTTLSRITNLSEREDDVFDKGELFPLFDVDFFTLSIGDKRHYSFRDDVRDLAATAKVLIDRLINEKCGDEKLVRRIHDQYVAPLPDSRTLWRLRLYVWSLCSTIFRSELRDAFFRVFASDKHLWAVAGGAEYEWALKKAFGELTDPDKAEYKQKIFDLARKDDTISIEYGILSSIYPLLSEQERDEANLLFKVPLKENYRPEPSIGVGRGGTVVSQAPPQSDDEWGKPVPHIVELLKSKWSPENVRKLDSENDFLRPINAEGVGEKLRESIAKRTDEYVANAPLFFDRAKLDSHYTYSFLRGIQEAVRADSASASAVDWTPFFTFVQSIVESGTASPFDRKHEDNKKQFDAWLAGWAGVHQILADVFQELLRETNGKTVVSFERHRTDLLITLDYLLKFQDPVPDDEVLETARSKTKVPDSDEYLVSEPFTTAINTARGRSFQAFLYFIEQDSKIIPETTKSKLSEEVKTIYHELLTRENTQALTFMFGHYLAFFYYRDDAWMKDQLGTIFSHNESRKDLYLAAWEGYLSASLYRELLVLLNNEYEYAISLDPVTYTKRQYRSNLDDALATHLALAYVHYDDFKLDSDLFVKFWETPNVKRHAAFVSFVGRSVISRDQPEKWLEEHPEVQIEKLQQFWDWVLERHEDPEVYKGFGFWMQAKYKIFDHKWLAKRIDKTLEKTGGDVGWELGLMDSLPNLVKADPGVTLSILRRFLIDGSIAERARGHIRTESEDLLETLRTLYRNTETKEGTYALINDLLPIGNGHFWNLKAVLRED